MNFVTELSARIRKQIGLEFDHNEDYSFFQPTGHEHLLQFFYKNLSEEFWDLDSWNRHHLFLCELSGQLEYEFTLDEDGNYASLHFENGKQNRSAEVVMDLRDDYIIPVYYFGDPKTCLKVNQQLKEVNRLHPCYLGMSILEQLICDLEEITKVEYEFEQYSSMFMEPVVLKGSFCGNPAQTMYSQYIQNYRPFFNIKSIAGRISDESQGNFCFESTGLLHVDDCRLTSFMEIVGQMFLLLHAKYKSLVEKCILNWSNHNGKSYLTLDGNIIELWFKKPIEKIDGLLKYLTKGDKQIPFFGVTERISRKLWSVKSIRVDTKHQVEIELSDSVFRVYMKNRNVIPVLDTIEDYLRTHIAADIENLNY